MGQSFLQIDCPNYTPATTKTTTTAAAYFNYCHCSYSESPTFEKPWLQQAPSRAAS